MRFYIAFVGLLAAACTGTVGGDDDDGNPPPSPPAVDVQMTVHDGNVAQPGIRVLFQNADDSVIAEVVTDANGFATADMPNGGNLTVIRTFPPVAAPATPRPSEVYTYVGVKAGDRLQLGHATDDLDTPSAINVKVPDGAQGTIKVVTACGSGTGPAPLVPMTVAGCAATMKFYVEDQNQLSFIASAPYAENVDLSTASLTESLTTTLSATGVSPDMSAVNVEVEILDGAFPLFSSGSQRVDTQPASTNLPNVTGVDGMIVATIQGTKGTQMVAQREAYSASPTIIDASTGLIPYVTAAPTYAPTGVSWVESGTGTADFVFATLDVTRGVEPTPPPEAEYIRAIIAPHAGTSLTLPMLTGADAVYNPSTTDQITGQHGLVQATGGYDAARASAFSVGSLIEIAPMSGQVTVSYFGDTAPSL